MFFFIDSFCNRKILASKSSLDKLCLRLSTFIGKLNGVNAFANFKIILEFLNEEKQNYVIEETKVGGATLTKLLGTSAWYAPGAAVSVMVQAIACDQKKMIPCSLMLDGEYGQSDICLGVPAIIGRNGVEKIVDVPLTDAEKEKFATAAQAVREVNGDLKF